MRHGTKSQDYKDKIIEEGERIAQIIQDLEAERLKTIGGGTNDDQLGKGGIGNGEKEE